MSKKRRLSVLAFVVVLVLINLIWINNSFSAGNRFKAERISSLSKLEGRSFVIVGNDPVMSTLSADISSVNSQYISSGTDFEYDKETGILEGEKQILWTFSDGKKVDDGVYEYKIKNSNNSYLDINVVRNDETTSVSTGFSNEEKSLYVTLVADGSVMIYKEYNYVDYYLQTSDGCFDTSETIGSKNYLKLYAEYKEPKAVENKVVEDELSNSLEERVTTSNTRLDSDELIENTVSDTPTFTGDHIFRATAVKGPGTTYPDASSDFSDTGTGKYYFEKYSPSTTTELDGMEVVIVGHDGNSSSNYAMYTGTYASNASGNSDRVNSLTKTGLTQYDGTNVYVYDGNYSNVAKWYFEATAAGTNSYHIYTYVGGAKRYLSIVSPFYRKGVFDNTYAGSLSLAATPDANGGTFLIELNGGDLYIRTVSQLKAANNRRYYFYLNYSGSTGYYIGWNQGTNSSGNSIMDLYTVYRPATQVTINYDIDSDYANFLIDNSGSWGNQPQIPSTSQTINDNNQTLYSLTNASANGTYVHYSQTDLAYLAPYYNAHVDDTTVFRDSSQGASHSWGKEIYFVYWEAQDTDGRTCSFANDAPITVNGDSTLTITDISGVDRTIADSTTFKAIYLEHSDVALFFVNHFEVLPTHTSDLTARNTTKGYTEVIAVGHIYNGIQNKGTEDNYSVSVDNEISQLVVNNYERTNPDTQIVIDGYFTVNPTNMQIISYTPATDITLDDVSDQAIQYMKQYINEYQLSSSYNDKPVIHSSEVVAEDYSVLWHRLVQNRSGWYVKGLLEADTKPLTVTKTNYGLLSSTETNLMTFNQLSDSFRIQMLLDRDVTEPYFDLVTSNTYEDAVYGLYNYGGKAGSTYSWTANILQGVNYVLEEKNYNVTNHTCSTAITINYINGNKVTNFVKSTETMESELNSANVLSVSFDNFYTPVGEGAIVVKKVIEGTDTPLSGAVLNVVGNGTDRDFTTDTNGVAYIDGLTDGTYLLLEKTPPSGYVRSTDTWEIVVSTSGDVTTVTVNGVQKFNTTDGISDFQIIENLAVSDLFIITKTFSGINASQVQGLTNYRVQILDSNENVLNTLSLTDADVQVSVDGLSYTWSINGKPDSTYKIRETGYIIDDLNTIISSIGEFETTVSNLEFNNTAPGLATFDVEMVIDKKDQITILNSYTNAVTLQIEKVDQNDTSIKLQGARFKIYSTYSSDPLVDDIVTVGDDTYYYMATTSSSNAYGILEYPYTETNPIRIGYKYALVEIEAPTNYYLDSTPVLIDTISTSDANLANGVYTKQVKNGQRGTILIKKNDSINALIKLEDAQFKLERLKQEAGSWVVDDSFTPITRLTDGDGEILFENLELGKYRVTELKAPVGYNLKTEPIEINISSSTLDVERTVGNISKVVLPATGGKGTIISTLIGLILVYMSLRLTGIKLRIPKINKDVFNNIKKVNIRKKISKIARSTRVRRKPEVRRRGTSRVVNRRK